MRLWTFQHKTAWDIVQKYGVFYGDFDRSRRLKMVDEQYVEEGKDTPQGFIDTAPTYCFASMGKWYRTLSLSTMYGQFNRLVGWMQFRLENMIMFELEVPESFILSSKKHSKPYMEYINMPAGTEKRDRWKYAEVCDENEIEHEHHLAYMRSIDDDDVECLIPYVSKEYIVAVRTFSAVNGCSVGYSTCKIETVYVGKEYPMWTETIYVNGDGYPRVIENGEVKTLSLEEVPKLLSKYGMCAVYPYMTVENIYDACSGPIVEAVRVKLGAAGLTYKDAKNYTYEQLLKMESERS